MASPTPSPDALALFDNAACGLMQTTDDGTFLRANRTFCRWVGVSADALVGHRRFQDLLTMGGKIFHQTHWVPLLRMQGSVSEVKLEVRHHDGTAIPMVLNAIRHELAGVVVVELAAYIARDRDRYEQELLSARKRLEDLVAETQQLHAEAKDRAQFAEQMIGIVSHDLRNPLSTIHMGASMLGGGDASPRQARAASTIRRAAERATRLIEDLLDFTQARVGKGLPMSLARMDVHEVVAEALEELRLAHPRRDFVHERDGAGGCIADASRLAQALGNLVSNAVAYGAPETPVTLRSIADAGSCAVSVHNVGAPIPVDLQSTIFEPMTRGTKVGGKSRSVGLGLYIVREIARAHRGDANVHSTADAGTTFRIAFPRLDPP